MNRVAVFLARIGLDQPLNSLANQISDQCENDLWNRLSSTPVARSLNEARGFVRARATVVVSRAAGVNEEYGSLPAPMRQRVVELAHQRLVDALAPRLYEAVRPEPLRRVA